MERFWSKVDRRGDDECWPWNARTVGLGYGTYTLHHRKQVKAHRLSWEIANGPIPAGLCVCHRCDNPRCCNPRHLFLGTHTQNIADRDAKGRTACGSHNGRYTKPEHTARGERHGRSKITASDVLAIRSLRSGGATLSSISAKFKVGTSQIWRITIGQHWGAIDASD